MSASHRLGAAARGLSCLFLLLPALALAQPADPIVVTATRLAQPLTEVLADLRVIDRSDIERAGTASLTQLLQRHGGVEISANGGPGQVSGVFLRGSNAGHVVLLIDGVRVNSASAGTNALEHLPLEQIERIEVLRGPASGLYGADAIGGVIQIFTRQGHGLQVSAEIGAESTRALAASYGQRFGATTLSLQAGLRRSRNGSATNAGHAFSFNADDDPYRNRNAGLSVDHDWARGQRLTLRGQVSQGQAHFDAGPGSDDVNDQRLSVWTLESRNQINADWTSLLRLARGSDDSRSDGAYPSRFRTDQDQLSWQNDLNAFAGRVAAGAEWRREGVDSATAFSVSERRIASVFASYAVNAGHHGLQLALRHDRNSQFGGRSTGNAAWGWRLAPGWRVSAAAGTAFKAPSFNDLYYPLQYGYSGNPALRPERSRSVEAALRYERAGYGAGLTLFDNRIRDLIAINSSFTSVENVARARNQGLTLNTRWRQGAWQLAAEWTHQQPQNTDTGAMLTRRARNHGSASIGWTGGAWRLGADLSASGARLDTSGAGLGGYGLLHLSAAWSASPQWTLRVRVDNAADKAYTLVDGYNTSGRQAFVALEYRAP